MLMESLFSCFGSPTAYFLSRDPKMCSQIKFRIPRMYARGHDFSRSDDSGKGA